MFEQAAGDRGDVGQVWACVRASQPYGPGVATRLTTFIDPAIQATPRPKPSHVLQEPFEHLLSSLTCRVLQG